LESKRKNQAGRSPALHKPFKLAGFVLDSPLGLAAGFDKNGEYILGLRQLGFGFVEVGTVTPLPQAGNPEPRLFRVPESQALINRMGFNNDGALMMAARLKQLRQLHRLDFPVGINLGKNKATPLEESSNDYCRCLEILYELGDYFVVNVSSPNTPGLTGLQEGKILGLLLSQIREARDHLALKTKKPLFLKLSPDLDNASLCEAAALTVEHGFTGVIACNTTRERNFANLSPLLAKEDGGLSGRPLAERSREVTLLLRNAMPRESVLISVGGVFEPQDVRDRLDLGADLVQVYSGFVYEGAALPLQVRRQFKS
jgi:dihydroorotate dehydrogenase